MTDKRTQAQADHSNMEKDPADWVTGDEPMTGAQRSYLKTLSEEAKEPFDDNLSKAQASRRIDELQARTGRGKDGSQNGRNVGTTGQGGADRPNAEQAERASAAEQNTAAAGFPGA